MTKSRGVSLLTSRLEAIVMLSAVNLRSICCGLNL